jgi:hypothetical protein
MANQFIRLEPFSYQRVKGVVGEADRIPEYCSHIESPTKPTWMVGSADVVLAEVERHMGQKVPYRRKQDRQPLLRRRRSNHRCLVAGFFSWPTPLDELHKAASEDPYYQLKQWMMASIRWLKEKFGHHLVGVVGHKDESHLHFHFFLAGDANKLHPGLAAEFENGVLLKSRSEKIQRHKAALRQFLDEYHLGVGASFGLSRHSGGPTRPRIKDRKVANAFLSLTRKVEQLESELADRSPERSDVTEQKPNFERMRM